MTERPVSDDHAIPSDVLPNLRDPGGWPTTDGRSVRRRVIYRSAAPTSPAIVTDAGIEALGITTVIDLRTGYEAAARPDQLPAGARLLSLDVLGGDTDSAATVPAKLAAGAGAQAARDTTEAARADELGDADAIMRGTYRDLVSSAPSLSGFSGLVRTILEADGAPVLYHCTAGKDRTGWATAVLMTAAGATPDAVRAEYLAVNPAVLDLFAGAVAQAQASGVDPEVVRALVSVDASYLAAAFDQVDTVFGGFDAYLREGLGLDPADQRALRDLLTRG